MPCLNATEKAPTVIAPALIDALRAVVGKDGLVSKAEDLLVYECDAYTLEKNLPGVVVLPGSRDEVIAVVRLCAEHKVPIIPRGAGTSLSGAVLAVSGGVMIALTRLNRLGGRLSQPPRLGRSRLRERVDHQCGQVQRPSPGPRQSACTIGGNVATIRRTSHAQRWVTTNHVLGFEMVLPDGEAVWLGTKPDGGEDVDG